MQYLFYCKRHEKLFEQLQKKISEASKRISRGTLRYTPVSTPTPTTPGHNTSQPNSFHQMQHLNGSIHAHTTPQMVDPLALSHFPPSSLGTSSQPLAGDNNYVNTEQPVIPQTPRNNTSVSRLFLREIDIFFLDFKHASTMNFSLAAVDSTRRCHQ